MSEGAFASTCSGEFEQKVADLEEKVDYWKQVLADPGRLKIISKGLLENNLSKSIYSLPADKLENSNRR